MYCKYPQEQQEFLRLQQELCAKLHCARRACDVQCCFWYAAAPTAIAHIGDVQDVQGEAAAATFFWYGSAEPVLKLVRLEPC